MLGRGRASITGALGGASGGGGSGSFNAITVTGSGRIVANAGVVQSAAQAALIGIGTAWGAADGVGTQAMADANQTPAAAVYQNETIALTGALTANRNLMLPTPAAGQEYTKTIDNQCTGAFAVVVTLGGAGTTVNVLNGTRKTVRVTAAGVDEKINALGPVSLGTVQKRATVGLIRVGDAAGIFLAQRNPGDTDDLSLITCDSDQLLIGTDATYTASKQPGTTRVFGRNFLLMGTGAGGTTSFSIDATNGTRIQNGNFSVGSGPTYGGGANGVVFIRNAGTLPTTNPTAGGILYADAGALKWRGPSGAVTTIGAA